MNEFEIGKKIAELEYRIQRLEGTMDNLYDHESEDSVEMIIELEGIYAINETDNSMLSIDEEQKILKPLNNQKPLVVLKGSLVYGKTGFPQYRNYIKYQGDVKLQTIERKDIECNFIVSSSIKGKGHRYPNVGQSPDWEHRRENVIWGHFGVRYRVFGTHRPCSSWAKFNTKGLGTWIAHWQYGR